MKKTIFTAVVTGVIIFSSCDKEDVLTPPPSDPKAFSVSSSGNITTVKNLPADTIIGLSGIGQPVGTGKYSFFSLETGQWIANVDSATTKWDLAFAGTTIRVNNATSGPTNRATAAKIAGSRNAANDSPVRSKKCDIDSV